MSQAPDPAEHPSVAPDPGRGAASARLASRLDAAFPPAGPCAFCGDPDKRHRLWDSMIGQHNAGDSVESIALDFGVSEAAVLLVVTDPDLRAAYNAIPDDDAEQEARPVERE